LAALRAGIFDRVIASGQINMNLKDFRNELLDAVMERLPDASVSADREFAFLCEFGERLTQAEEFVDLIPAKFVGVGAKNRKIRVDAYELDPADDSLHLVICDFSGKEDPEPLTRSRAEALFGNLQAFAEDSISGRIWNNVPDGMDGGLELARHIGDNHDSLVRYRFYLLSDSTLSDRVKDLPQGQLDGRPVDYHVWDVGRLETISASTFGAEELEIDFTEIAPGGLPCLMASQADDYQGYLAVIPGAALAELYDRFGGKLLEGNVRSFLSASGKINRGIQGTIRAEPAHFFVYNNGISTTATSAVVVNTPEGPRLVSARYFQIVNGGQTTASLHVALKKDRADLSAIHVPMKLSVVTARDTEKLDDIIQSIAKFSNKQNKVSDADFFSNHPYHRTLERLSRRTPAPAADGAQFNTYWFYERARGQYQNTQANMTPVQKREFQRTHPRHQLVLKTDIAKFENSWMQLPHVVSQGAQKNFTAFAEHVNKHWGEHGHMFESELYFRELIAKAILFRGIEKWVSEADWYEGGYRANIVTYTIAKLASMIALQKPGHGLDFKGIWARQALSDELLNQVDAIGREVAVEVTTPPEGQKNAGEWCKRKECWERIVGLAVRLNPAFLRELVAPEDVAGDNREKKVSGKMDAGIHAITQVIQLGGGYWGALGEWAKRNSPIYGRDADYVRNASRKGWIPTPQQAAALMAVRERIEQEGFRFEG